MRAYSLFALFAFSATAGWGQHFSTEGRLHGGTPESGKGQGSRTAAAQRHAPSTAVAGLAEAPTLELTPLAAEAAAVVQQTQAGRRVGRVRGLAAGAVGKGAWASLTDGRAVWRLAIRSPEATELRVHFTGFHAGGGRVWIYSDGNGARVQEFSGDGVHGDGDFWTSTVSAERLTIEFAAEDGLQHDAPPFQIAEIGHLWELTTPVLTESAGSKAAELSLAAGAASPRAAASALSLAAAGGEGREIAGCHLDVACFPEFKQPASAVARIIFAASGGFYVCSGSLVNSKSGNGTPLFLTADHCINNEESARSVQANFFYESESCGGGLRQVENVLGANYLVSGALSQGDFSLIRLLGLPQSPVFFLGITTVEPAIGTRLTGIHHPEGSYKRISFGPRTADETVGVGDGGGVTASPASKFYQVDQREGRVEGGSSGSPLLNPNKQLVGMLSSGPVFSAIPAEDEVLMCLATEVITQYGRVSTAWPSLEPFVNDLRPGRMAVPQAGDKFASKKVKFQWSPGVGVTQYRLQLGKTKGGSEYVDVTQRAGETSFTADGLPEDGSPVYARLGSLVDGAWSTLEYTYLASSGGTARPAQIVSPSVNGQLTSSRVEFTWDEGNNVSEYLLYVGTSPGGIEFARANRGQNTFAVVENLPGNGQTVYARLYSRVGSGWEYRDAVYRAADTRAKTFTLKITNRLAYPVAILVNEQSVMSVLGNSSAQTTLQRVNEAKVEWQLVRPGHPVTGLPMGESLKGSFAAVVPAEELAYEITNAVNGALYFTPVVSNATQEAFYVEVNNGTPTRALLGAINPGTANAGLGYYRLQLTSSVRGYHGFYGYSGPYTDVQGVAGKIAEGSGVVRVDLKLE